MNPKLYQSQLAERLGHRVCGLQALAQEVLTVARQCGSPVRLPWRGAVSDTRQVYRQQLRQAASPAERAEIHRSIWSARHVIQRELETS